ncbi:MAG: hypothetical protein ABIB47_04525 [Candidatus Woesearchaeota archaeon]
MELSRREFISWLGSFGALLLGCRRSSSSQTEERVKDTTPQNNPGKKKNNRLGFLSERRDLIERLKTEEPDYDGIVNICVALGPEFEVTRSEYEYSKIISKFMPKIKQLERAQGISDLSIKLTISRYGIPEEEVHRQEALDYCKRAMAFATDRLPNLDLPRFEWVAISEGDDFSVGFDKKVLLGLAYHKIYRLTIEDKNNKSNGGLLGGAEILASPFGQSHTTEGWSFCYVGTGVPFQFLIGPFSELIPRAVEDSTEKLIRDNDAIVGRIAVEGFSEALSYLLALEFVKIHGVKNGEAIVKQNLAIYAQNDPLYQLVIPSIGLAQSQGLESFVDLYRNDPDGYLQMVVK